MNDAVASAYRKADTIRSRAQAEANAILERAISERRLLQKEVDRLRQERDELQDEIASLRRGELAVMPDAVEPDAVGPAFDLRAAVAEEMRAMLAALLEEIRVRPAAVVPSAALSTPELPPLAAVEVAAPIETAEPILDEHVELLLPELPPATEIESEDVLAETPLLPEYVDTLATVLPPASEAGVDERVEQAREPEPPPRGEIESEDVLAETWQPIVNEHVEEFRSPAAPLRPLEGVARDVVEVEPPRRMFDEYVEEFAEPKKHDPVLNRQIEEQVRPEAPMLPAGTIETEDFAGEQSPIVDEFVEELPRPEAPEPPAPAAAAIIEALWETAAPPTAEVQPPAPAPQPTAPIVDETRPTALPPLEPASFITDEFIAATRPGSPHEADVDTGAPPPLIDVSPFVETEAPSPIVEMAAPPPIAEPMSPNVEFPASEPAVSEERGVRQIQVRISPVHSFPRLIEIQGRIQSLSSVHALQLRDFRNGVATFAVGVAEAISPQEFGAVIQMLENLHLRLEGTGQNSVELRAEDDAPSA